MKYETIRWKNNYVELIDQRLLPDKLHYVKCKTAKDIYDAIKKLKIRGAPAIGVAAAYGAYLGVRESKAKTFNAFCKELHKVVIYVASARPTARNLFWALERMAERVNEDQKKSIDQIKLNMLKEAHKILDEDNRICLRIGTNGAKLIKKGSTLLTHCNAGGLATASYGTALGVIFSAKKKIKHVYVDETRPVLQGSRLTAWEMVKNRVPATLICDNMAASLMKKKKIDAIIVGADRIADNGDVANKIGTYNLAVLAKYHKIPFYVAAPVSTFDLSIKTGRSIVIEERDDDEVRRVGKQNIAPKNMRVYNPAFDVTPAELVTAIITERGVIRRPSRGKIGAVLGAG